MLDRGRRLYRVGKVQPVVAGVAPLPIGLAHGVAVKRDIPAGRVLTLGDVDLPEDDVLAM